MRTWRDRRRAFDRVAVNAVEVIAILRLAILGVKAPATGESALGDDYPLGPGPRHDYLRRHGVRLVLDVDDRAFAETPHAAKQQLPVALGQLRPACDVGIGALGKPVVQGQHVVLDRLDQPQPLQFVKLLADSLCDMSFAWVQSFVVS